MAQLPQQLPLSYLGTSTELLALLHSAAPPQSAARGRTLALRVVDGVLEQLRRYQVFGKLWRDHGAALRPVWREYGVPIPNSEKT